MEHPCHAGECSNWSAFIPSGPFAFTAIQQVASRCSSVARLRIFRRCQSGTDAVGSIEIPPLKEHRVRYSKLVFLAAGKIAVKILSPIFVIACLLIMFKPAAQAVPSYSRQTGLR